MTLVFLLVESLPKPNCKTNINSLKSLKTFHFVKRFDTSIGGLIYSDQFLQITTKLPTTNVYGFGENVHRSLRHDFSHYQTFPLFAHDISTGDVCILNHSEIHIFK